jgi:hypothetical protein
MRPGIWLSTVFAIELIAPGCSATTAPSDVPYKPYAERAETQTQNGLSVTAGILTAEEARTVYGVDLAGQLMQPVWIEVRNDTGHPYWLLA